jgi:RNA polymerase sigma factor (sigma-70 family)
MINRSSQLKEIESPAASEHALVEGCRRGDRSAADRLYHLYVRKMRGLVFRYARTTFDIEDILQEGFIRVFDNISAYSGSGSFEGWVRRIMINSAINYYKKNLRLDAEVNFDAVGEPELDAVEIADNLSVEELYRLIGRLPEGYRIVLNLYAIDGYTHKEIAEMLNIEENSASSRYSRAKKYLSQLIKETV